jgi:NAD(P)-dependent dehydrogenase (short-subunit alcohol dehydrogenase family)
MTLKDRRVVVLGGSSGIGFAVAKAAAAEGATVVIASSSQRKVEAAASDIGSAAAGHALDLADERAIASFFDGIGAFDHLAYTAGENLKLGALAETDVEAARQFWNVRYWGAFVAAKHAAPHIRPGGSIVLTSGLASARPHPGWSVASSICGAVEGFARALATELAPIRVNVVAPGVVRSPLWDGMPEADREALYERMGETLPVGHVGEVEEIAEAYLYLMRQTYGTGHTLAVDGGGALV